MFRHPLSLFLLLPAILFAGCMERTGFLPNQDPSLRKLDKQFTADAANRFPYKDSAPRGTTDARAEVDYMFKYVGIANLSDTPWKDVEVWINRQYVVSVSAWPKDSLKRLQFSMFRDERGNWFTTDSGRHPIKTVEVYTDGKMYDIPLFLAD
ncbi:MAG TPA: hypothetical protein VFE58_09700 [Tepidisphaeraceae bacterium]|jgi:hypothetical protein|nr:hypothetical protein [Tepidisphaeraceae bacterium]